MPLTPETGAGLPNADSPSTMEELNAWAVYYGATAWTSADVPAREVAARKGSNYLEGAYGGRLLGIPKTTTQRLSFPRINAQDPYGRSLPADCVWPQWKEAHFLASLRALAAPLRPDLDRGGQVLRKKIGPIETEWAANAPAGKSYPEIEDPLRPILDDGARLYF